MSNILVYIIYWIACFLENNYSIAFSCIGLILNYYAKDDRPTIWIRTCAFYALILRNYLFSVLPIFTAGFELFKESIATGVTAAVFSILILFIIIASICCPIIMLILTISEVRLKAYTQRKNHYSNF